MAMTPLPPAPNRAMDEETFSTTADTFVAALPGFVTEANALEANVDMLANEAMIDASNAATSESNASASATLASQWASTTGAQVASTDYSAKEYAIGTTVPAGSAKKHADDALSYKNSAEVAAAAAQSAAGLPSLAGNALKFLQVNSAADGIAWQSITDPLSIGDILVSARPSASVTAAGFLPCDGSVYLQSGYAALFSAIGLLPDYRLMIFTTRTSSFGTTPIRAVTYGNGLFVAVGYSGLLATSPDGITWTQQTSSFGTTTILGVTYGNGLFVAVGYSGLLATSPDGISWTQRTSSFGTTTILGVTYGNGLFVAVSGTGKLATSPDGISWTQRTSSFGTTPIYAVTYGNGLYVAVGDSGLLATSPDGKQHYNNATSFISPAIAPSDSGQLHYIKATA